LPHERADNVTPVANDVNEPRAGKELDDQLEQPRIERICVARILVAPVTDIWREAAVEVTDHLRESGAEVLDELVPVREQQTTVLRENGQGLVEPRKEPRLLADEHIRVRVEDPLDVRGPGARRA